MWIKICGNTNLEDALLAAESGADALGFVFAPSPRQVDRGAVQQITRQLPAGIETIGVFVDAGFEEIAETVAACGLTGAQLHRSSDPSLASRLRERFPGLKILAVMHYKGPEFAIEQNTAVDGVLVDSSTAKAVGGTGTSFNWAEARRAFLAAGPQVRLIAAGGLSPENVEQAIETLEPWGVDVVSGVERAPGKKDPARVRAFIRTAREAAKKEELKA
jgi:phosphoribosylanthranilate isomerase